MTLRGKRGAVKVALLTIIIIAIVLIVSGCVRGLAPIGWSGGTAADDTLFVGSNEGRLVAIDLSDGSRRWAEPLKRASQPGGIFGGCAPAAGGAGCGTGSAGVAIYGTPVVSGELVYLAGYNGKIYAYNTETLAIRWIYPREGNLEPLVGGGIVAQGKYYVGGSDHKLYALDALTGDKLWEFSTGDKIWSTPAASDGTIFIGSFDNKMYALNAEDGSKKWEFAAGGAVITTPLVHDGTIYFGSFDRNIYAVNTADGSLRWKFPAENWFWAQPVLYNDTVYAGSLDGKVYALKADTGALVADFDLGSPVSSTPVIIGNSIIFASRKGVVYTIDADSNEMRQLVDLEEEVNGPLAAHENIVFIHTHDLTLHPVNVVNGAKLNPISLKSLE